MPTGAANLVMPTPGAGKHVRGTWLLDLCQQYVNKYIGGDDISGLVDKVGEFSG